MKTNNNNIILEAKQLSIGYKTKKKDIVVASDINFKLLQGQLIGLVGANGIGKSTLLRTLIKVQPSLSGDIFINNNNLQQTSNTSLATQLSIVLTEQLTSKNLSVFELVSLGRNPYTNWVGNLTEDDIIKVNEALELVNITELKDQRCFELSDGQLQKVMIARALSQDTDIIVLDEPTTHLDMYHKAYILKLLQRLAKETHKTILFSSHEIDLAIQLCDTMLVMTGNNIICDQPSQLIKNGVFNSLFPKDMIAFDEKSGSFKISK
ncbi:MAG: ABC transporter ATP-binding protein [Winogradskyella sp.]|uniref:ABC transporter ATP-binding protein n=1 Tax=Winogradskyella sp. TaxID=1883156 RepID=UPI000F3ED84E|nr:ABC transporter ATP-binding protein [Winogradskyella sp.]RNC86989.1 MAG: ABC transporter ATP-binding protein [Winogradskyella sp.]